MSVTFFKSLVQLITAWQQIWYHWPSKPSNTRKK